MLYLIGTGIENEYDISLRGLNALKGCAIVYSEQYTCPLEIDFVNLEKMIGKNILPLSREEVENGKRIVEEARTKNVALLVGGDPLSATTHHELLLDAKKAGVATQIIHSSSIFTAIAETGLFLYKFGKTVSLPFPQENYFPESPYLNILSNKQQGMHTLLLLDIGMTANLALETVLKLEEKVGKGLFSKETKVVACAHLGGQSVIRYDSIEKLLTEKFGKMPHTLIIPGELHFHEEEFLAQFV